jgi:hypothetical protein
MTPPIDNPSPGRSRLPGDEEPAGLMRPANADAGLALASQEAPAAAGVRCCAAGGRAGADKERLVDAGPVATEQEKPGRQRAVRLRVLWVWVSGLWTVATVLRIYRVWVPILGSRKVVDGPWLWFSLIIPPVMFAFVLAAIYQIKRGRR